MLTESGIKSVTFDGNKIECSTKIYFKRNRLGMVDPLQITTIVEPIVPFNVFGNMIIEIERLDKSIRRIKVDNIKLFELDEVKNRDNPPFEFVLSFIK